MLCDERGEESSGETESLFDFALPLCLLLAGLESIAWERLTRGLDGGGVNERESDCMGLEELDLRGVL